MTQHDERLRDQTEKRDYEAPEVHTEEVFETLALICTKAVGQCGVAPGTETVRS